MNDERMRDALNEPRPDEPQFDHAPNGLFFPIKRLWWFFEKHFLWPIGDSFRRIRNVFSYRSPLAYIGATLMLCMTAGAVAVAVYFYNEAQGTDPAPVVAEAPLGPETVVAPVTPPPSATAPTAQTAANEQTLQGVVPNFSKSKNSGKKGAGSSGKKLPATVVKPAKAPSSGPLKVAHGFAESFVSYEIGDQKATRALRMTATPKLARELKSDPPRLPSNGQVPQASVMNVLKGKTKGKKMEVSVSLMRSGASSELRLGLTRKDGQWLVSEVRG